MAKYLEGEKIFLRTIRPEDFEELYEIMNDCNVLRLTGSVYPNTEKKIRECIELSQNIDSRIWFVIVDKETDKIIGETGFLRIFMPWRTSDYSLEIWNKEYWGKGIGREVAGLMFDYGFNYLNFHRLAIGVVEKNQRAMRFWKSVGFIEEGRQVQGFFSEGEYSDFVMMYFLEDDYRKA
ncbi:MAG: GNAT family N-acetyltransferase [Candidatus Wallbacteria bacterium HGW-Wallbacteria-1]|uniref:GNAT family N-acetyltransferase n=1 Tax=Candidatus Wallbacteria bacterium HGW-Wallbacteria-1 TaxID=2013854 RepID=A0A2N1PJM3_9BACT|nr:MAG: GNAT family N-acetyltransferase [Candidatus Wallbacteria bacterium HGW-Wallbacteria-1]